MRLWSLPREWFHACLVQYSTMAITLFNIDQAQDWPDTSHIARNMHETAHMGRDMRATSHMATTTSA